MIENTQRIEGASSLISSKVATPQKRNTPRAKAHRMMNNGERSRVAKPHLHLSTGNDYFSRKIDRVQKMREQVALELPPMSPPARSKATKNKGDSFSRKLLRPRRKQQPKEERQPESSTIPVDQTEARDEAAEPKSEMPNNNNDVVETRGVESSKPPSTSTAGPTVQTEDVDDVGATPMSPLASLFRFVGINQDAPTDEEQEVDTEDVASTISCEGPKNEVPDEVLDTVDQPQTLEESDVAEPQEESTTAQWLGMFDLFTCSELDAEGRTDIETTEGDGVQVASVSREPSNIDTDKIVGIIPLTEAEGDNEGQRQLALPQASKFEAVVSSGNSPKEVRPKQIEPSSRWESLVEPWMCSDHSSTPIEGDTQDIQQKPSLLSSFAEEASATFDKATETTKTATESLVYLVGKKAHSLAPGLVSMPKAPDGVCEKDEQNSGEQDDDEVTKRVSHLLARGLITRKVADKSKELVAMLGDEDETVPRKTGRVGQSKKQAAAVASINTKGDLEYVKKELGAYSPDDLRRMFHPENLRNKAGSSPFSQKQRSLTLMRPFRRPPMSPSGKTQDKSTQENPHPSPSKTQEKPPQSKSPRAGLLPGLAMPKISPKVAATPTPAPKAAPEETVITPAPVVLDKVSSKKKKRHTKTFERLIKEQDGEGRLLMSFSAGSRVSDVDGDNSIVSESDSEAEQSEAFGKTLVNVNDGACMTFSGCREKSWEERRVFSQRPRLHDTRVDGKSATKRNTSVVESEQSYESVEESSVGSETMADMESYSSSSSDDSDEGIMNWF